MHTLVHGTKLALATLLSFGLALLPNVDIPRGPDKAGPSRAGQRLST